MMYKAGPSSIFFQLFHTLPEQIKKEVTYIKFLLKKKHKKVESIFSRLNNSIYIFSVYTKCVDIGITASAFPIFNECMQYIQLILV